MKLLIGVILACAVGIGAGCGRQEGDAPGDERSAGPASSAVNDYAEYAADLDPEEATDPELIAEGLRKLAGALGERGVGGPEVGVDLRVAAEHVLLNPASPQTADTFRGAMLSAAEALGSEGAPLRTAAESITANSPLDNQGEAVARAFDAAAVALGSPTR